MTGFGRRNFLRGIGAGALVPMLPKGIFARAAAPSVTELIAAHHARAGNLKAASIGARYGLNPRAAGALAGRLRLAGLSLGMSSVRVAAHGSAAHGRGRLRRAMAKTAWADEAKGQDAE